MSIRHESRFIVMVLIMVTAGLGTILFSPSLEDGERSGGEPLGEVYGIEIARSAVSGEIRESLLKKQKLVQSMRKGFSSDGAALDEIRGIIRAKRILLDAIERKMGIVGNETPKTPKQELALIFRINKVYGLGLSERKIERVMYGGEGIVWPDSLTELLDPNTWKK